ncbi:MAG TPA: Rho termination factor N-terminal domain-containing protein, partial [Actinomycetes bacterium]|nr:Rho termination factor N-terminal domain-containing protein [Actinomycetes bacterium]
MATTERGILEGKVLPELQAIASSMGVQGYQRLRKADLIGAIIAKAQGVEFVPSAPAKGRRGGATTNDAADEADQPELPGAGAAGTAEAEAEAPERRTRRRNRSG